jgi:GH24 family phage-related lysozyme (muramidase)
MAQRKVESLLAQAQNQSSLSRRGLALIERREGYREGYSDKVSYNLGGKAFGKSTLLKNINAGKDVTKENFTDWTHAGGKAVKGLTIRRTDEFNVFSKGDYGGP